MSHFTDTLNPAQKEAVLNYDKPSLIVAGAGSGKTRVLTSRIAYMIEQGVHPGSILALTFTNKAAREMRERIEQLVPDGRARYIWMGTFHSVFYRILRQEAGRLGFDANFTIYDTANSESLLSTIIKERNLNTDEYKPRDIHSRISLAKNNLVTAEAYAANTSFVAEDRQRKRPEFSAIFLEYARRCKANNAMDFDDLLIYANILFRDFPDALEQYRNRFSYILVDEYQDTNYAQYLIVRRLEQTHSNVCVVGDDAQSIYSFRGAKIENILRFQNDFPEAKVFKLEQNYRSTKTIVSAANSLISHNDRQIPKDVFSDKEKGSPLHVYSAYSDIEEAEIVVNQIAALRRKEKMEYDDFAILYRTNARSRTFEEALRKRGMPYRIYGGLSFYQRKEVKDVISYFRLVINPHDEEAFKRVINYPTRGIGDTTVSKLVSAATTYGVSLWTVLQSLSDYAVPVNAGTAKKLAAFRELIDSFRERNQELPADEIATAIVKESGIVALLAQDHSTEGIGKFENLQELLKGIAEFCQIRQEEGNTQVSLGDFLAEVSLLTDQDQEGDENTDKVTLMTVHAAKGLEFGAVFVVGLEEELFPSAMSKDNPRAIEEERRLFYVAITRAERHCTLSFARSRFKNGQTTMCIPSRFLRDIDLKYLETEDGYRRPEADSSVSERKPESRPAFTSPLQQAQMRETPSAGPRKLTRMTAAPVSSAAEQDFSDFQIGMRVRHGRFGEGVILSFDGDGNNRKALIEFDNSGQKQLFLKFARLEKI